MQVASDIASHIGYLMRIEVIGGIKVKTPVLRRLDITVKAQCMCKLVLIFELARVKVSITQLHAIAERKAPGHFIDHIAIRIELTRIFLGTTQPASFHFTLLVPFLSRRDLFEFRIVRCIGVCRRVVGIVVIIFLAEQFAERIIIKGIRETRTGLAQTA